MMTEASGDAVVCSGEVGSRGGETLPSSSGDAVFHCVNGGTRAMVEEASRSGFFLFSAVFSSKTCDVLVFSL